MEKTTAKRNNSRKAIQFRVSQKIAAKIAAKADEEGLSVSAWIRHLVIKAIQPSGARGIQV